MDLNHAVYLLARPRNLELNQEYGLPRSNNAMRSQANLAFGLTSIRHLDASIGLGLRLCSCKTQPIKGSPLQAQSLVERLEVVL